MITAVSSLNLASTKSRVPYRSVNVPNAKCASQVAFKGVKEDEILLSVIDTSIDGFSAVNNSLASSVLSNTVEVVKVARDYSNGVPEHEIIIKAGKSVGKGMITGGMTKTGAAIGTAIFPGVGTVIGGALGFLGGCLLGKKIR